MGESLSISGSYSMKKSTSLHRTSSSCIGSLSPFCLQCYTFSLLANCTLLHFMPPTTTMLDHLQQSYAPNLIVSPTSLALSPLTWAPRIILIKCWPRDPRSRWGYAPNDWYIHQWNGLLLHLWLCWETFWEHTHLSIQYFLYGHCELVPW